MAPAVLKKQPNQRTGAMRRADLAAIHMWCADLGWDEDTYRDIMATVCGGIRSAGELDFAGRQRLMDHMRRCAVASSVTLRGSQGTPAKRKPLSPKEGKLWSMWMQLADKGLVEHRTMAALNAWVRRQSGVQLVGWLNNKQFELVLESMKAWLKRGA